MQQAQRPRPVSSPIILRIAHTTIFVSLSLLRLEFWIFICKIFRLYLRNASLILTCLAFFLANRIIHEADAALFTLNWHSIV